MKILITGGCGFIGSHLVPYLLEKEFAVKIVDNFSNAEPGNLGEYLNHNNLELMENDIINENNDWDLIFSDVDRVVHLAGPISVAESITDSDKYFNNIVTGTYNILKYSRLNSVKKLVYAMTAACYGEANFFPTSEEHKKCPDSSYALMKLLAEEMLINWGKIYNLNTISLRLFNLYGERSGALFGLFVEKKRLEDPLTIIGDGTQERDFVCIDDVVKAFEKALFTNISGRSYNISSGKPINLNSIARFFDCDIEYIEPRKYEFNRNHGDISAAKNDLNWEPQYMPEIGIPMVLDRIFGNK